MARISREQLMPLSPAELVEIILQQQALIEQLQVWVTKLAKSIRRLTARARGGGARPAARAAGPASPRPAGG